MKRGIWMGLLAALLLGLTACKAETPPESTAAVTETTAVPETTEETVPETTEEHWDVTAEGVDEIRIFLGEKDRTKTFTDGDRETQKLIGQDSSLTVESEEPFAALYLEWAGEPRPYRIQWEGGETQGGAFGFQHEYVRLPEAVTAVAFQFPEEQEPVLCELRAFTEGAAPAGVQDWRPPCQQPDMLVFPTHSDDDTLFFGALISYYAIEMNLDIQTAFMTRHYEEPIRAHERLDGLWEEGICNYPILSDMPDLFSESLVEAKYDYAGYDILGWQVEQIRRFKPKVIVGHDLNGEYGHGGHMLNAHTLTRAVELAAQADAYPELVERYGTWDTPKLYLHLYPENQIRLDVDRKLENDPRTPFQIAQDAYGRHKSQHWCDFRVTHSDPDENCVEFGLYRSLVGEDTTGDLMDNIGYS